MNNLCNESIHCCIETIAPRDDWLLRIGHRFINLNYLKNESLLDRRMFTQNCTCNGKLVCPTPQSLEKTLYEIIEACPIKSFNYLQSECIKNLLLITRMALYLSPKTIEVICDRLFKKKGVEEEFAELMYQYFFSVYLRRTYSWSSLHMLIKASKAYPAYFKTTITVLLRDIHLPNNILLDYIETLNKDDCTKLMKFVAELQLTSEQFDHNLSVIYLLFKKCEKNDNIFQYVLANLEFHSLYCAYNKNFGRLLLCYIQSLSGFNVRIRIIKKIMENHCTTFKNLCVTALESFVLELIALQMNIQDTPRIVIPRPVENFQL